MSMAIFYAVFTALVMFNMVLATFKNFFDSIYWGVISLTSVGYDNIIPVLEVGKMFTMLSTFIGVAIIVLLLGIITDGYLDVLSKEKI